MGDVEGLFIATEDEVKNAIGKEIYFGEILGKHSKIYGTFDEKDVQKLDLDSETVEKVTKLLGKKWSGYNPLHYVQYFCEKCGYKYHTDEFNLENNICNYCFNEKENKND